MSYQQFGVIEAKDYNLRVWGTDAGTPGTTRACLYRAYGTGYGNRGLGQAMDSVPAAQINPNYGELYPVTSSPNANTPTGSKITAVQWTGLITTINRMKYHQLQSNLTLAGVKVGDRIQTVAALDSAISGLETSTGTGRTGAQITGPNFVDNWTAVSTASDLQYTVTRSATFATSDAARYFFNAGGYLRIRITATDQSGGVQRSSAMAATIAAIGSANIDANGTRNTGMSGAGNYGAPYAAVGKGYWQLGPNNNISNYQSEGGYGAAQAGVYTSNYITCGIYFGGTQGSNGDNGDTLYVRYSMNSGYASTGTAGLTPSWQTDSLNLNITTSIDVIPPATLVLSNSWGQVAIS